MIHVGNWSLFTKEVSGEPLYAYYNPVALDTVVRAEEDLLSLIEDEGPFDGCLGFCGGAKFARGRAPVFLICVASVVAAAIFSQGRMTLGAWRG